jgi:hypothetical protein
MCGVCDFELMVETALGWCMYLATALGEKEEYSLMRSTSLLVFLTVYLIM